MLEHIAKILVRLFKALARYLIAITNIGLIGTIKIIFCRISQKSNLRTMYIKKLKRNFFFRGIRDYGVLTHFFKTGVKIHCGSNRDEVKIIIDAGANIGSETLRLRHFHPNAKIFAIEGNRENFNLLKKNIGEDNNTKPILAALHNKSAKLKSYNPSNSNESFRFNEVEKNENYDVLGVSLENIINENEIQYIDILKCDIEGSERFLFDNSSDKWINKVKVIIMECPDNDAEGTTAQVYQTLERNSLKFNTYINGENLVLIKDNLTWEVEKNIYL